MYAGLKIDFKTQRDLQPLDRVIAGRNQTSDNATMLVVLEDYAPRRRNNTRQAAIVKGFLSTNELNVLAQYRELRVFTVLRDPIERALSYYFNFGRHETNLSASAYFDAASTCDEMLTDAGINASNFDEELRCYAFDQQVS